MRKIILACLIFFIGCSPLEFSRLLGAGTRVFREKGKVCGKDFDWDYFSCYAKITRKLEEMEVCFYRGSRQEGFLVLAGFDEVFAQCNRSTEVAIFFTDLDGYKTRVEIASLNYALAEFVASEIFGCLENGGSEGNAPEKKVDFE